MENNDNYSSSDDETVLDDYKGKNGVMFLLDFRREMSAVDPKSQKSYIDLCFNTCKNLMIELARFGKDDLVGIALIGTSKGNSASTTLLADIQPLGSVTAERIKEIDAVVIKELENKYGRICKSDGFDLVKVLTSCMKLFSSCRSKIYTKTVVLMTSDDDPFGTDNAGAHNARKRAKMLSNAAIDLNVVGFGDSFRPNKFYNELIALARGYLGRDWESVDRVLKIDTIHNHLTSFVSRLSRTNRNLIIGEGVSIPVSLYKLFKEPKVKLSKKVVERKEPSSTVPSRSDTVGRSERIPLVAGKPIDLTHGELEDANFKHTDVGITVIGYMPTRDIPQYLSITIPRVMLPNYFSPDGLKAFSCMLEHCRQEQLSMVCWYRYNKYSYASLVACHPMSLQFSSCPNGFCVTALPFFDNYSDPEFIKRDAEPSEKQRDAAKSIVKKLSSNYLVDMYHDYELQKMLAMVESLALNYDEEWDVCDDTIIDDDDIDSRISCYAQDFNDCSHLGPCDSVVATKRGLARSSFRATKNPRLTSLEDIFQNIVERRAEALTVAQLKQALDAKGIGYVSSAKKADLVQLTYKITRHK